MPEVRLHDLPRRSVRGGAAVLAAQMVNVLLGIVSVAILGRLLTPGDFGLIAMTGAFLAFVTTFADLGLPLATVQRAEITDDQVNALFWMNAAAGAAATVVGALAAWPIARFYDRPELVAVTAALAVGLAINGLSAQHQALLRREMRFTAHSLVTVAAAAAGVAVAIGAAAIGARYWALVLMPLVTAAARTTGMWIACPWRPSAPRRAEGLRPMIRFGAYLTGTSLLGTAARNLDRILIGHALGAATAGLYTNALRLVLLPASQLNVPLTSVVVPTLSRLQNEPDRFRAYYRRGLEAVAMTLCPFMLVALVAPEHMIPVILGGQWTEAVPIVRAMAPAALLASINVATSWVYVPLGRSDRQFRWHLFRSACVIAAYAIGIRWGAVGVAAAFSVQACVLRVPALLYCLHGTPVRMRDVGSATWRIGAACAASTAVTAPLALSMRTRPDHLAALAIIVAALFATYLVTLAIVPGGWTRLRTLGATLRHLAPGP
jgi:PST family polysaccharide transporter